MNPRSARTLLWSSAILIATGSMIGSPEAGTALHALAALCALVPVIACPGKPRIVGGVLLIAALGSAFATTPAAKRQMERYMERPPRGETTTR